MTLIHIKTLHGWGVTYLNGKTFIHRRDGVTILGDGYIRFISNDWYIDINTYDL